MAELDSNYIENSDSVNNSNTIDTSNPIDNSKTIEDSSTSETINNSNDGDVHVCQNCDTKFVGNFCPNCGQSKVDIHRPFSVLLIDLLGNVYAFDTRVLKTLKSLFLKPGEMANDYVHGRRVRYMPPFRLYVFISFIFFLLLSIYTQRNIDKNKDTVLDINNKEFLAVAKDDKDSTIATSVKYVDGKIVTSVKDATGKAKVDTSSINNPKDLKKVKDIANDPGAFVNKYLSYFSWSLFILMPVYALLLWGLFRKGQRYYLAHFIFSICQHTFAFIIFIVLLTINLIFPEKSTVYEAWLLVGIPLYSIIGSKKLYKNGWIKTLLKLFFMWFVYMFIIIFAIAIVAYILVLNM